MTKSNQVMKNLLITVGIIALVALILFGIFQTINNSKDGEDLSVESTTEVEAEKDANPLLSEAQEKSLGNIGVDPGSLPTEITPAMQICFVEKLGLERAEEIADGDSPTPGDYIKAKSCLDI